MPPGRERIEGWFAQRGWAPYDFQRGTWDAYARGESGLVNVATGAGKTYAAFLGPLIELMDAPASESAQIWEHVKTLRRRVAGFN